MTVGKLKLRDGTGEGGQVFIRFDRPLMYSAAATEHNIFQDTKTSLPKANLKITVAS